MSEIVDNVASGSLFITDIIVFITSFLSKIVSGIGMREIILFILICGLSYYFWKEYGANNRTSKNSVGDKF